MEEFDRIRESTARAGFVDSGGYYSRPIPSSQTPAADRVWSRLAREDPIHAAAAGRTRDWFTKYPAWIEDYIPDRPILGLDAGCGYGRVSIPLLRHRPGLKLVGVDASPVMLETFHRLLAAECGPAERDRALLFRSLLHDMPFSDGQFDILFSCAVLLHNPYRDVQTILGEFARILKPGGNLILVGSFPNLWNLEGLQAWVYTHLFAAKDANGPVRVYTRAGVQRVMRGWRNVEIQPRESVFLPRRIGRLSSPKKVSSVNHWLERMLAGWLQKTTFFSKYFDVIAER